MTRFPDPAGSRAVLIGVSRYEHPKLPGLPAVRANLADLKAVLTDPVNGTLRDEHCVMVHEPRVPTDFGLPVTEAAGEATDVLLVYYAGHGIVDGQGRLHLAVFHTDPARTSVTALPYDVLREAMLDSRAAVKVLVLDCCFSGRATGPMGDEQGLVGGQIDIAGTYVLASSSATKPSRALPGATHTAFTEALLAALRHPDPLTLDALFDTVHHHLLARSLPLPERRVMNTAGGLTLVKGPPAAAHPGDTPPGEGAPPARWNRRGFLVVGSAAGLALGTAALEWVVESWSDHDTSGPSGPSSSGSPVTKVTGAPSPGQTLAAHKGAVLSVAFRPAGEILASGSADRTIRLWKVTDPAKPVPFVSLTAPTDNVDAVAFSPDGGLLAGGGNDNAVRLWKTTDPTKPKPLSRLTGHTDAVFSVAFNPDGTVLASGSADRTLRLWNVSDPAQPTPMGRPGTGHTDAVLSVAFSPDPSLMATGSADNSILLWNVATPPATVGAPVPGHKNRVHSVVFSPDGKVLASAGGDRTVRLWNVTDLANPTQIGAPLTGHTDAVYCLAFTTDGKVLASAGADKRIRLWNLTDPAKPKPLGRPLVGHTDAVHSVAFTTDGKLLASAGSDNKIRLWTVTG
ncbi:caspase, EACC1-associated type [Streptomyces cyanogenus]|uniref:WD domain, G-beta repeat n=1 Tax=Streptomyces cyanogenus TaxID=80860 RepID=A0ABX7TMH6_STRCY|nr:caspase family protein [Streptomyces cyanogenus]QTD96074.1 WD domain, G-beta repeat [Streptomyces cyanogenus]